MMAQTETKRYTAEEYLELEVASETRNEYRDGEIVPMTGGTPNHNDIAGNLYILLKSALKGKDHRIFYADQRLWIPGASFYTYPDVMVLPKPLELQAGQKDTVMNPCLIAEVLSKSTRSYDRGDKFAAYRTISSFQEYLLIDQDKIHVEHHVKVAENQWLFSEYNDPEFNLSLRTLDLQVQIANLYENIEFSES
ncbi:Uma2 family endonuclease [Thermoleptolyngbya sp. C42_A2020_037]|uniref:Uma2 family endonuclease n=1 Tax=Thermoleptolyngbya sp. C42_A2020_037 TaxID=2747799 RepID=UPI001A063231|nr:Uma2 family endonuclease [Thermoleptolyngbya sp. C42_A2020_037]MBF2085800.1 Uma2 family endonuclease [Thermoleptolyngbya sp. C42_A2020_037]